MHSRRDLMLSASASAALASLSRGSVAVAQDIGPPPSSSEAQTADLLEAMFRQSLADSPEEATRLGLDKGEGAAAKSRLDDRSAAQIGRLKAQTAENLRRFQAIDRTKLTGMAGVNYDSVAFTTALEDEANRHFAYGEIGAGSPYVISQLTGAYCSIPDFLGSQHVIETKADADAYLARLGAFGEALDQETERARADAGRGVIPPDFVIDRTLLQMKKLLGPPETSTLVTSVASRAQAKGITGDYAAAAGGIFAERVAPALNRQIALLNGWWMTATPNAGCWRLPDGEAYYALSLRQGTTTALTPDEIHQMGLDQARDLSARADLLLKKQGFTQGTVGARIRALMDDPQYRYANTNAAKEVLIGDLNGLVKAMRARLPAYFGTLPKAPVEIRRTPPFLKSGAPGGYYDQPSLDGSRPGIYWINLRNTAETPRWALPTLTYHEAIPGHHVQLSLQQEADLPMIRRATFLSAYGEGWALYAEQLAQEMGVYADDPLGEIGYLQAALFRAARLVVDTGLHARRWTREQAVETMGAIDGDLPSVVTTEVERYCVLPGQACSYMVGKLTWLRLRDKAKAALGDRFDIRQFHDAGLLSGAMPLSVLEHVIDSHIAQRLRA